MNFLIFISSALLILLAQTVAYEVNELKCQVCTRVIEEMKKNISQVDIKKTISVGGFRIDDQGNYIEKSTLYARSEVYLTELMENICNKMDDYIRATFKDNGKLTLISVMSNDGKMNPDMGEVDIIQDSDLNKSLKYYCEDILHEHDDAFINEFSSEAENAVLNICARTASYCDEESILAEKLKEAVEHVKPVEEKPTDEL